MDNQQDSAPKRKPHQERAEMRRANAMRENLRRRKAQATARQEPPQDEGAA
jgi:hypothetical protein